ncbi:glycerate kinase isoform X1 [Rhincodon typus]|uniref:glycerate kinase isoform X1 n=1 Tax=Rhincodon typus TaxID=259920 RepID=UPI0009A31A0B|nr:glycerate kinase isoform X1 [Rhincodon typus]XP_048462565.1 glycerate kinase isoform X1 [Rhincodon typus]XP_048462566.1 glycerate kinase isoform X1 [Rhincodon typus]XP_048462567.1 glycerate kinase isoform X1 [Rhincodon typus]XP_048462568.1 glycerate kinase isoform X1 [Rhincodon typus]XP_048462569.1 glycerate kinase isoform X1 [Rhincodon typus]XP_048462570.1 glycerate kinase isoform X1 [Rhincodon typus]XP_048462571.1 glycerate kinase isoform X1 [Rhincodon typus]XP_048462572.1 glycerate ki
MVTAFGRYLWLHSNYRLIYKTWKPKRLHLHSASVINKEMSLRQHGLQIFQAAINAVLPQNMIKKNISIEGDRLMIQNRCFPVHKNVYLVGFGKAVLGMAAAMEEILGDHLLQGVISIPLSIQRILCEAGKEDMLLKPNTKIQAMEGARHNLPDENALKAANTIRHLVEGLAADDLLFVLISGGGSALLPAPIPPITLEEKQYLTKQLAAKGATIQELNTVRKMLSVLKGGGLARAAYPAQVVSLIMSDVIGDNLEFVASGPTVLNLQSKDDCHKILSKYNLSMPESVKEVLSQSSMKMDKEEIQTFDHVCNFIVGSNAIALEEAKRKSESLGYNTSVLSTVVSGDVRTVAKLYSLLIRYVYSVLAAASSKYVHVSKLKDEILQMVVNMELPDFQLDGCLKLLEEAQSSKKSICLLAGGETTVQLQGKGKGGRNQELALHVALELHRAKSKIPQDLLTKHEVIFLSAGTDGQDGPTEAAGAFAYGDLVDKAFAEGLNPEDFLNNNDSFTFFNKFNNGVDLIVTGLTNTNVMDVQAIIIQYNEI